MSTPGMSLILIRLASLKELQLASQLQQHGAIHVHDRLVCAIILCALEIRFDRLHSEVQQDRHSKSLERVQDETHFQAKEPDGNAVPDKQGCVLASLISSSGLFSTMTEQSSLPTHSSRSSTVTRASSRS